MEVVGYYGVYQTNGTKTGLSVEELRKELDLYEITKGEDADGEK